MRNYANYQQVLCLLALHILLFNSSIAQNVNQSNIFDYRTINGSFNDLRQPFEGQAGITFARMNTTSYYQQDGNTMVDRGNVRRISNQMFNQYSSRPDPHGLSSMVFTFLQFLDHDIALSKPGSEEAPIPIPYGDPQFDPFQTGNRQMSFTRGDARMVDNQRQQINENTAWIDASMVYGSEMERAHWLRSGICGKLKVSPSPNGDLLPCNTTTGNCNDSIDPNAPTMDGITSSTGQLLKVFVAGDVRANEQPGLTALHTVFLREHNRICDELIASGRCNDEQNYQYARKMVSGFMQSIVYNELLPALGVLIPERAYQTHASGEILNSFITAAYRLGHTMVTSEIPFVYQDCQQSGNSTVNLIPLEDAFFNPSIIQTEGITPILRGLHAQTQERVDAKIVSPLRNLLFGPPGAGGLDLAALNIQRGRDHGLPDYNSLRTMVGLPMISNFTQINSDPYVAATLEDLYGTVQNVDPWVGLLSEQALPGKVFGPTLQVMLTHQFDQLRNADRFYYSRDPLLLDREINNITSTTLADIIERNTLIRSAEDVFFTNKQCDLPITEGSALQVKECNEVLINYNNQGYIKIEGVANLDYQFEISSDPMGIINSFVCTFNCGHLVERQLPRGTHYVQVKNAKNREVCSVQIAVNSPSSKIIPTADLSIDYQAPNALTLFPNPARNSVTIALQDWTDQNAIIYLTNTMGQVVQTYQKQKGESDVLLKTSNYPTGLYQVAVALDGASEMINEKLIIH